MVYKIYIKTLNISYAERKIFGETFLEYLVCSVVIFDLNNTFFLKNVKI